jgi:formylmethanofuran dehydrogenase subunit B
MAKGRKTGGRSAGTPNRKTSDLCEFFESAHFHVPTELMKIFSSLDADKQVDVLMRLMEYLYPKRKAALGTDSTEGKMGFAQALALLKI